MIGYCATASSGIEIAPIRQMKRATTQAKMGRSMKKAGMRERSVARLDGFAETERPFRSCLIDPGQGIHTIAWRELLEAVHNHAVTRLQPVEHQPLAALDRTEAHRLKGDAVVALDHVHVAAARAVALDRLLRQGDRIAVDSLLNQDTNIHARQQLMLGV